jgi:hypothetical protein
VERGIGTVADAFFGGSVVRAERKGGRGVRGLVPRGGEIGKREGALGTVGGTARRSASSLGRRTRAAGLWRDRGGRRGKGDPARARLTDGAEQRRGPVGSG